MWPWGHLAGGYVFYWLVRRYRFGDVPDGWPVATLAIGTQISDVIDKPIAGLVGVVPEGRALGHSLFFVLVVGAVVTIYSRQRGIPDHGFAFCVGLLSHPLMDALKPAIQGEWNEMTYLLWPVLPPSSGRRNDLAYFTGEFLSAVTTLGLVDLFDLWNSAFLLELGFGIVILTLWLSHGAPPMSVIRSDGEDRP